MTTFLSMQGRNALLVAVALRALLTPPCALAAAWEGPKLFFSVEDLQQTLSHPSLLSSSQLLTRFVWQKQPKAAEPDGLLEWSFRWGNDLVVDGDTRQGTPPLWGY